MIKVVDYGVGNIAAFLTVFKRMGIEAHRARNGQEIRAASRLVLPGVGHFDHAMQRLNDSGLRPALDEMVLEQKAPIIGVCVGMQMLASSSDEGSLPGLNWIPGRVRAFSKSNAVHALPTPHMGWNDVNPLSGAHLFSHCVDEIPQLYFLHSYYFEAEERSDVSASASYGITFDAAVSKGHIHGVQFHPEKSHHWGARLLKNFAEI
jgi:glutamine amidotransferase